MNVSFSANGVETPLNTDKQIVQANATTPRIEPITNGVFAFLTFVSTGFTSSAGTSSTVVSYLTGSAFKNIFEEINEALETLNKSVSCA